MRAVAPLGTLLGAMVLGAVVPWLFMRMLEPSLAAAPKAVTTNFRGRRVYYGLGIVWLVWAGAALVGGVIGGRVSGSSMLPVLTLAGPLALVAFALGAVDDAYGSGEARGFRGHLGEMKRGRLTTGGLKLIGIGLACLVVGAVMSQISLWGANSPTGVPVWAVRAAGALVAGGAIALTSNFINLMDLRPGRALKVYSVLSLCGVASVVGFAAHSAGSEVSLSQAVVDAAVLAVFVLGPVVAVWSSDLGERGMLGDAGANPMGAVAGMLIVLGLPWWGLLAFAVLMFGLNVASERVSYSRLIEANTALRWVDGLGRMEAEGGVGAGSGPDRSKEVQSDGHDDSLPE